MTVVGFHSSHEQLPPSALLAAVRRAEEAGFGAAMCSDHLTPWGRRQGHSGYAWSWLAAALATTSLEFGVVTAPGYRYHPAIAAQKLATLAEMFPERFWAALGSGEAMNEHVTGEPWPEKAERDARLLETVDVIRRLLDGEEVSVDGRIRVDRARVWSLPETPPPLFGAAVTPETARRAATWADGIVTIDQPREALREFIAAYRDAGGRGPVSVQVHLSWAPTEDEAVAIAHDQWRNGHIGAPLAWELDGPDEFDRRTADIPRERIRDVVQVSADPQRHLDRLAELPPLGVDRIYLHHVGTEQAAFIDTFGDEIVPALAAVTP